MKLTIVALLAALLMIGCTGAVNVTSNASPTPTLASTPTLEPTPTLAPTPTDEPLVEPVEETPEPEPSPTPDSGVDEWLAYLNHNVAAMPEFIEYSEAFVDQINVYDSDGAISVLQEWDEWLKDELRWFKANPAHKCYAKHQSRMVKMYKLERKAIKNYVAWLYPFPYGSDRDYNRADKAQNGATREMERNNDDFDKFDTACT